MPVFFPPEGRFGHAPVHRQPGPVDALQTVIFQQPGPPHLKEEPGLNPLLKAVMRRGPGAKKSGVQGLPLAAGAEHEENGVHADPIRRARLAAAERVGVHMFGNQPFDLGPQIIRNAPGDCVFKLQVVHGYTSAGIASCTKNSRSCIQLI